MGYNAALKLHTFVKINKNWDSETYGSINNSYGTKQKIRDTS